MSVARIVAAVTVVAAVLAAVAAPAGGQEAPGAEPDSVPEVSEQVSAMVASGPVLGTAFVLEGAWVASGVVWLDWGDVGDAAGYELMYRSADGWLLLSQDEPAGGVVVAFEGSGARVVGLPVDVSEHWFAVRARSVWGVSAWSDSVGVGVPAYAQADSAVAVLFDPFTAPTRSGIDLERLREAVATVTPGRADCSSVPALSVAGIAVVDPPATLGEPDVELAVAEVVRIAGGCLTVDYVALAGRTVNEVRELLAAEPSVHAVGAPVRGLSLESHGGGHVDDGGGEQWHLAEDVFKDDLWRKWETASPVTVAVLDTGVTSTHPDLFGRVSTGGLDACHRRDPNGHGTHVAGIVAADNGDGYVAGVAPDAEILSVRVLERAVCEPSITATAAVAAAVNAGARVINMSFKWPLCERDTGTVGGLPIEAVKECDPDMYDPDDADDSFELALRAGSMLGVVAITSVGNDGEDADDSGPPNQRNGPAVYPDVISVAAFNRHGQRLSFSTANDLVDIAAPGGAILSAVPLLECNPAEDTNGNGIDEWGPLGCGTDTSPAECAPGTALREFSEASPQACAHRIGHKSGTSMASPFVAGVVAHMLNRHPQATVGQVRDALEKTAVMPPAPADKAKYPGGSWTRRGRLNDPPVAPPSREYGSGIINPVAAVARLGVMVVQDEAADSGGFVAVAAGGRFSCGLRAGGRVRCWGANGVVANTPRLAFDEVSAPTGPADHACGINMSSLEPGGPRHGTALCWSATGADVPRVVKGTLGQVVTGFARSCGLRPDQRVVCWDNDTGASRDAPSGDFTEISGGWLHFCGRRGDNTAVCWGSNTHAQTDVPAGVRFRTVDAGGHHTCGITVAGGVRCWGQASATTGTPTATQTGFVTLDAGRSHTCAIRLAGPGPHFHRDGGAVTCWGSNTFGQADAPDGGFTQVSAGWRHSCGRRPDATVVCWGSDSYGQAPQARLKTLSLTLGSANLITFNPDVTEYTVVAEPGQADLAYTIADHATSGPSTDPPTPADANPVKIGHQVDLVDGLAVEVRVASLFGFGESRTYRINVSESPRLASLRVVSGVPGPHCRLTCPQLALDPVFDSDVFDYSVVAPADLSRVTLYASAVGGRAAVSPADADTGLSGDQVALTTDRGFVSVDAGGTHACGVKTDATVACWGSDFYGQSSPPSGSFVSVALGYWHSCGLGVDATVACWGSDFYGQSSPPSGSFKAVASGQYHSCGLKSDDSVTCWGHNSHGQSDSPAGEFMEVSAGALHSCAIDSDGELRCWGSDFSGQTRAPKGVFVAVSSGGSSSCALSAEGRVQCWGINYAGQADAPEGTFVSVATSWSHSCGLQAGGTILCWGGSRDGQAEPPQGAFTAVAAGISRSCGLRADGSVLCWGSGASGQTAAPSGSITSVSAGGQHSCGLGSGGALRCWGNSYYGQSDPPSGSFSSVSAGDIHSCGVKTDASVVCWGYNVDGETDAPAGTFDSVSAGSRHSCGIRTDGSVVCWGANYAGQSGAPEGSFSAISAGSSHSCGVKTDATVVCWGSNSYGQTGAPSGSFTVIAASWSHSCGIKTDASVVCWGYNGSGRADAPAGFFSAVSAGAYHSCGVKTDASVVCWGDNISEQSDAPAGSFTAISAGRLHACAVKADDSVVCWGERTPWLEPARSHTAAVAVASRADAAVSARYTVTIQRPRPVFVRAQPATRSRSAGGAAGTGSGGPVPCADPDPRRCIDLWPECSEVSGLCPGLPPGDAPPPGASEAHAPTTRGSQEATTPPQSISSARDPASSSDPAPASPVLCPVGAAGGSAVAIADAVLRAVINRHLDKAPDAEVTAAEMAELTTLELAASSEGARVVSLSGLEHAANLASLDLNGHDITDISALSCLSSLTALDLVANTISDISTLSTLTGLTTLGLAGNSLTDTSALSGLSSLTVLDLSDNRVTAITSLSGLNSLRRLDLGRNKITSVSALSALTGLEALYAYDNQITDIVALSGLTGLTSLHLDHNQITGTAALSGLTSLRTLGLGGNQISDIAALRGLAALETLYLFDNNITHAAALADLRDLDTLWIDGNDLASPYGWAPAGGLGYLDARHNLIADIAPLDALATAGGTLHTEPQRTATVRVNDASLRAALLAALGKATGGTLSPGEIATVERLERVGPASDRAPISDLSGLEHATSLTELRLRNNNIVDIEPITGLDSLERLDLQANRFADLAQLEGLRSLRWLNLMQNNIASIDALPALPTLEMLFVDFNNITDITPLAGRRSLTRLGLVGNNITDISTLAGLTNLDWVMISANNITDITALASLERLYYLRLTNNNISDLTPLSGLTGLTNLHLYRNNIADLEPLRNLTNLEFLDLRDNNITSIEELRGLANLRDLYIDDNHITDFTPLDGNTGLTIHGRDDQTPTN